MNISWLTEEISLQLDKQEKLKNIIVQSENYAIVIDWNFAENNKFDIFDGQTIVKNLIQHYTTDTNWQLPDKRTVIKFLPSTARG